MVETAGPGRAGHEPQAAAGDDEVIRESTRRVAGGATLHTIDVVAGGVPLELASTGPGSRSAIVAYVAEVLRQRTTPNADTSAARLAEGLVTSILHRLGAGFSVAAGGVAPGEDEVAGGA